LLTEGSSPPPAVSAAPVSNPDEIDGNPKNKPRGKDKDKGKAKP
jgi:hypothetical protein